jgi:hypothetical protein
LQIDKKKEKKAQICLKRIKIGGKKTTAHSQNILHVDALYNIKRKKYKSVCAELAFVKVQNRFYLNTIFGTQPEKNG